MYIQNYEFEWDEKKAQLNVEKHGVSFCEAASIFLDSFSLENLDLRHSQEEVRFLKLGKTSSGRVLLCVFTKRKYENGKKIRIISARRASEKETKAYEEKK